VLFSVLDPSVVVPQIAYERWGSWNTSLVRVSSRHLLAPLLNPAARTAISTRDLHLSSPRHHSKTWRTSRCHRTPFKKGAESQARSNMMLSSASYRLGRGGELIIGSEEEAEKIYIWCGPPWNFPYQSLFLVSLPPTTRPTLRPWLDWNTRTWS